MSAPAHAATDSVGSVPNESKLPEGDLHNNGESNTFTKTFERTWQWYIEDNANCDFYAPGGVNVDTVDEGFHYLPYQYIAASVTPSQWQQAVVNASSFTVLEQSFEIIDVTLTKEEMQRNAAGNSIRSDFVREPKIIYTVDKDLEWTHMLVNNQNTTAMTVSNGYTEQWAVSKNSALLPRVKMVLPPYFNSEDSERLTYRAGSQMIWNSLCGNIHTMDKGKFNFKHSYPERYYMLSNYCNGTNTVMQSQIQDLDVLYRGQPIGMTESLINADVNHEMDYAPAFLLKLMPYFSENSPIKQSACMMVKCKSTIKFIERTPAILSLNFRELAPTIIKDAQGQITGTSPRAINRSIRQPTWSTHKINRKYRYQTRSVLTAIQPTPSNRGKRRADTSKNEKTFFDCGVSAAKLSPSCSMVGTTPTNP